MWLTSRLRPTAPRPNLSALAVTSWAGMRGVVTPPRRSPCPMTRPCAPCWSWWRSSSRSARWSSKGSACPHSPALDVRGPDPREDALIEATVVGAATGAGLRAVESAPDADPRTVDLIREQSAARVNRIWEQLGGDAITPSELYRNARLTMIAAERAELLDMRNTGDIDQHVLRGPSTPRRRGGRPSFGERKASRLRDTPLRPPDAVAAACPHLAAPIVCVVPDAPMAVPPARDRQEGPPADVHPSAATSAATLTGPARDRPLPRAVTPSCALWSRARPGAGASWTTLRLTKITCAVPAPCLALGSHTVIERRRPT